MKVYRLLRAGFVCAVLLCSLEVRVDARWADFKEASVQVNYQNTTTTVDSDGSSTSIMETELEILNERAKDLLSTQHFVYSEDESKMKLLGAQVTTGTQVVKIPPQSVEDKPVANGAQGFSSMRQLTVAYPNVRVGSKIYSKILQINQKPPVPGFYSADFVYGLEQIEKAGIVKIISKKPLYVFPTDPGHHLEIIQKIAGNYIVEIRLKSQVFTMPVEESNSSINPTAVTQVRISSSKSWGDIAGVLSKQFDAVLNEKLPEPFQKIADTAKAKTDPLDQIDMVTSGVQEYVSYRGDWRTLKGRMFPQSLSQVAASRQGDCKDFATVTGAILRKIGFQADAVLIRRDLGAGAGGAEGALSLRSLEKYQPLPSLTAFNHAILKVSANGKSYWIDPTNHASYNVGIQMDIADRPALVLNEKTVSVENTPELTADTAKVEIGENLSTSEQGNVKVDGDLKIGGRAAVPFTGMSRSFSKTITDQVLLAFLGGASSMRTWQLDDYDLSSRVVKDLSFHFSYTQASHRMRTTAGPALVLPTENQIKPFLTSKDNRVSDLYIGAPVTLERTLTFKDLNATKFSNLNCWILSPWLNASRNVETTDGALKIADKIELKKSLIKREEMDGFEYEQLQAELSQCFSDAAIVLNKNIKRSLAAVPSPSPSVDADATTSIPIKQRLRKYVAQGLIRAADLFNDSPQPTPSPQKNSKSDVAKNVYERAREAIDKSHSRAQQLQAKIDLEAELKIHPDSAEAYALLSELTSLLGYFSGNQVGSEYLKVAGSDADRAKQLDPKFVEGYVASAKVNRYQKNFDSGREDLKKAIELDPARAETYASLGRLESLAGNTAAATEAFKKSIELYDQKQNAADSQSAHSSLADLYTNTKQYDLAKAEYTKAISVGEPDAWIFHNYAVMLNASKDYDNGIKQEEQALKIMEFGAAKMALATLYRGRAVQEIQTRLMDDAIRDYKKAVEYNPSSGDLHLEYSAALFMVAKESRKAEDILTAVDEMKQAVQLKPALKDDPKKGRWIASVLQGSR